MVRVGERRASKLQSPFEGPYEVIQKNNDIYTLGVKGGKGETLKRHVSNLRYHN